MTVTKISTCKTSHNHSPKPAHASDDKEARRKPSIKGKQQAIRKRAVCITVGESEALGFHQETMEESRIQQNWFCIKILHYFVPDNLHFGCMVLQNIISTKHYFQHK